MPNEQNLIVPSSSEARKMVQKAVKNQAKSAGVKRL